MYDIIDTNLEKELLRIVLYRDQIDVDITIPSNKTKIHDYTIGTFSMSSGEMLSFVNELITHDIIISKRFHSISWKDLPCVYPKL